jgi:hypothetical protein
MELNSTGLTHIGRGLRDGIDIHSFLPFRGTEGHGRGKATARVLSKNAWRRESSVTASERLSTKAGNRQRIACTDRKITRDVIDDSGQENGITFRPPLLVFYLLLVIKLLG